MKYHFRIHKEKKGYWAKCVELEGCVTQGDTKKELVRNMREALNLFLSEPADSKLILPLPKMHMRGRGIVEVPVELRVGFAFYLRRLRLKAGFTQGEMAKRANFGGMFSYQKLESAKTANPVLETIARLKKVLPALDLNQIL